MLYLDNKNYTILLSATNNFIIWTNFIFPFGYFLLYTRTFKK